MGAVCNLLSLPFDTTAQKARLVALAAFALLTIGLIRAMSFAVIGAVALGDTALLGDVPRLAEPALLALVGTGLLYSLCRR